jgi:small subunit ribosomal protein S20
MLGLVANIKSQIKRIKTNEKRRLRNKAAKSEIKTRIKTALLSAELGDEVAGEHLRLAVKKLDKAAARGIIHRNQAANRKSALMARAARLESSRRAPAEAEEPPEEVTTLAGKPEEGHADRGPRRRIVTPRARRGRRGERATGEAELARLASEAPAGEAPAGEAPAGEAEVPTDERGRGRRSASAGDAPEELGTRDEEGQ